MSSPRRSGSGERSPRPERASAPRSRSRSRSQDKDRTNGTRDRSRTRSRSPSRGRHSEPARERSRSRSDDDNRSTSRSGGAGRGANGPRSAKIVIEKLTRNVHAGHLREIFGAYGAIQELEMPMNKQFMTNRGIAYILYAQPSYAESAIANMHEAQLDGALIAVSIVLPRRRFSRSPPPMRPPPNRFGEPHRHREGPPPGARAPPPLRSDRLPHDRGFASRASPSYGGPPGRRHSPGPGPRYGGRDGRGGGYRDRYDDRNTYPRDYSRSPPPGGARKRSPRYSSRSRSPSRTPPRRRSPVYGGGAGGGRGSRRDSNYSSRSRSRSHSRDRGRAWR